MKLLALLTDHRQIWYFMSQLRPQPSDQDDRQNLPLPQAIEPAADGQAFSGVSQITVQALQHLYDTASESLILVDVRFPREFTIAHLPEALLIPFAEVCRGQGIAKIQATVANWQQQHPNDTCQLVIYCTTGVRSTTVVSLLQSAGLASMTLQGGMKAWQESQSVGSQPLHSSSEPTGSTHTAIHPSSPQRRSFSLPKLPWWQLALGSVAIVTGLAGWYGYRGVQDPDRLRPFLEAGMPLHLLSGVPVLGEAVEAAVLPQISVHQLKQSLDSDAARIVLLDVRTLQEYKDNSLPGAVLVSIAEIESGVGVERVRSLVGDRQLVVYCTASYRSSKALLKLRQFAIEGVQVQGGFAAWVNEGYPLVPHS